MAKNSRQADGNHYQKDVYVEAYAGTRYPERPRVFDWEGKRLQVDRILRQWRTPETIGFRVQTRDGRRFTLVYTERTDSWAVRLYT